MSRIKPASFVLLVLIAGGCARTASPATANSSGPPINRQQTTQQLPGGWLLEPPPGDVNPVITADAAIQASGQGGGTAVFALLTDQATRESATPEDTGSGQLVVSEAPVWIVSFVGTVCSAQGYCDPNATTYVAVDSVKGTVLETLQVGSGAKP